jgi:hypothetical protein
MFNLAERQVVIDDKIFSSGSRHNLKSEQRQMTSLQEKNDKYCELKKVSINAIPEKKELKT